LARHAQEIEFFAGTLVAIGGDPPASLDAMREELSLPFPLRHDDDLEISRAYGVREDVHGSRVARRQMPVPSVFVTDCDGRIRYAFVGKTPYDRAPIAEVLAAVARPCS
jgi:peroxiredoxin